MNDKKTIWESALVPGLLVAAIPSAHILLSWVMASSGFDGVGQTLLKSAGAILLWAAKFIGGIMLFRFYLQRFAAENGGGRAGAFKFGLATSLLSSLIFAGVYMAYLKYLAPDTVQAVFDALQNQFSANGFSTDDIERLRAMLPDMPRKMFVAQLLYGFGFGTVLSALLTKNFE